MSTLYYVVEPGKADHLLLTLPNDDPPQVGSTIHFTGALKHTWLVVEVSRVVGCGGPSTVRVKEMTPEDALLLRYQRCAERIWNLFDHDPLPNNDPAQGYVERLEALLSRDLLAPKYGEPVVKAVLPFLMDRKRLEVLRALLAHWKNHVPTGTKELMTEAWDCRLKDLEHALENPCP